MNHTAYSRHQQFGGQQPSSVELCETADGPSGAASNGWALNSNGLADLGNFGGGLYLQQFF
ncbi:hypothetical protein T4B_9242 [Trichinella pseudospiralis]|uniref:Uncharacterized protein n=1 Tax=Trichinella pseudospiralis TaxID=6337 RepID=A0A0V1JKV5_TRIPS|nr:hypothetical protein T4A_5317 [Trichinella pseudospiralis]KRZ11018.1 hypothetical protein T4B_9242 [Trichinella pseudospiralis]KRZ35593.1 hypothetical protein T4C_3258 [Trichinella pseudospiralis]